MKARCGHTIEKSHAQTHGVLCIKCRSNFAFLLELEGKYGEDALIEYWYAMILCHLSNSKEEVKCFIDHLIDFYQRKIIEFPSKWSYISKMLYMLYSLQEPFNLEALR